MFVSSLQDCIQHRNALGEKVKVLSSEVKAMGVTLKQLSRDLEVLRVQDTALTQRIRDLEEQAKENVMDHAHLTKLEKQVAKFKKAQQKAAESAGEIQDQVNA